MLHPAFDNAHCLSARASCQTAFRKVCGGLYAVTRIVDFQTDFLPLSLVHTWCMVP